MRTYPPARTPRGGRPRSRTPAGRGRRPTSGEIAEPVTQGGGATRRLQHGGPHLGSQHVTSFPNSSGPRTASSSGSDTDDDLTAVQRLRTKYADAQYAIEGLQKENEMLRKENESRRQIIDSYRGPLNNNRLEEVLAHVRSGMDNLMQHHSPQQGSAWPGLSMLRPFHSKRSDIQKPEDDGITQLQRQAAAYQGRVKKLEAENLQPQHAIAEYKRQVQSQTAGFAEELEAIRNNGFMSPKISDSEIQRKWSELHFSVRQFLATYIPDSLDPGRVLQLSQDENFCWLPEMTKTLQAPSVCSLVLQSWVWHFLCVKIFHSHSEFWAGAIGKSLGIQFDEIRDRITTRTGHSISQQTAAIAQLHDWRVRSACLIMELGTRDMANSVREIAGELFDSLQHVTMPLCPQDQTGDYILEDTVEIIEKAVELDRIFRLSKAYFQVFITRVKLPLVIPPKFGFQFDPETMERIREVPGFNEDELSQTVDLAVSPGVFKAGNSDGANYDSERVLVKLQALCNLPATLAFLDGDKVEDGGSDGAPTKIKQEEMDEDSEVDLLQPNPEPMNWEQEGPKGGITASSSSCVSSETLDYA